MAGRSTGGEAPRRVGDFTPDIEPSPTLDEADIQGDVTIAEVEFHERDGDNGPYTLTVFTLDDGTRFHTSSKVIAERMRSVTTFPVVAAFERVKSKRNPRNSYWMVR